MNKLPPMKYKVDDIVTFKIQENIRVGVIEAADFGGAFELDYHSYDVFVKDENCLYKHIPEKDILSQLSI